MKRRALVVLGALIASFLVLVPGSAGAQDDEFSIDPDTGNPGDLVSTFVDPAAVERECARTLEEVTELFTGSGGIIEQFGDLSDPQDELEQQVEALFTAAMTAIATNFEGAGLEYLGATFILTFAEIATQEPVGEMSDWDPNTGEGEIVVPGLDPGLWAVAAACVEPQLTAENVAAALAAGAAFLADTPQEQWLDSVNDLAMVMFLEVMGPRHMWVHPFLIPEELPEPDPNVAAFCAVLPELQGLADEILTALRDLPEDDGEMSDEEWAAAFPWDDIERELRALFGPAAELIAAGDEARAEEVADAWETVTEPFRLALAALESVDYDLSTPSGRLVATELREGAAEGETGNGDGTDNETATDVLVQWFVDNCIPAGVAAPPGPQGPAAPAEETPRAAAVAAQPTFTG